MITKLEKTILVMEKKSFGQESEIQHYKKMAQSSNDDTMDAYYTGIQVVTGLTNLHIMLKDRKYIEPLEKVCPQIK